MTPVQTVKTVTSDGDGKESGMAGNYVIVVDFCDRAGPFLKFEKNRHIAARKLRFRFGSVPP